MLGVDPAPPRKTCSTSDFYGIETDFGDKGVFQGLLADLRYLHTDRPRASELCSRSVHAHGSLIVAVVIVRIRISEVLYIIFLLSGAKIPLETG